jgi:hypothetical protein
MKTPPTFVTRMDLLANSPTRTAAERGVLLASVRWLNADGELWPAVENWARLAGVKVRTLQRILRRLVAVGVLEVVEASNGGANRTTKYRIPSLLENPDATSGVEPRPGRHETPTPKPAPPDVRDAKPRPVVTQSSREQPKEQPSSPAGVVASLSLDLREHVNATPVRLAWIERDAPSKDNPEAWAASCIRRGWPVPPPTPEQAIASAKADRFAQLAEFDAMPSDERASILESVYRLFPNLAGRPASDPGVRGGILRVLGASR